MARGRTRRQDTFDRRVFLQTATGVLAGSSCFYAAIPGGCPAWAAHRNLAQARGCLVLYQNGETWEEVPAQDGQARELKDLSLIAKGVSQVQFQGQMYAVEREGLYRFLALPQGLRNLISLQDKRSLLPLLMALSALQVHGNRHDKEGLEALKDRLRIEPWICIACGNMTQVVASILKREGYKTRIVFAKTQEEENGYDDSHTLLEVHWPQAKKWILVDADMGFVFKDGSAFLNAEELAERVKQDKRPEFVALAQKAALLDPFFLASDGFNYALEFRWRWGSTDGKWRWYRRILQRLTYGT